MDVNAVGKRRYDGVIACRENQVRAAVRTVLIPAPQRQFMQWCGVRGLDFPEVQESQDLEVGSGQTGARADRLQGGRHRLVRSGAVLSSSQVTEDLSEDALDAVQSVGPDAATTVRQELQRVVVGARCGQVEFPRELGQRVGLARAVDPRCAEFRRVSEAVIGANAAADPVAALDHDHLVGAIGAVIKQPAGCAQAGHPRSHDQDSGISSGQPRGRRRR